MTHCNQSSAPVAYKRKPVASIDDGPPSHQTNGQRDGGDPGFRCADPRVSAAPAVADRRRGGNPI